MKNLMDQIADGDLTFKSYVWKQSRSYMGYGLGRIDITGERPSWEQLEEALELDVRVAQGKMYEVQDEIDKILEMTTAELDAAIDLTHENAELAMSRKRKNPEGQEKKRLEAMREEVMNWLPPTNDHTLMRSNMLQELKRAIGGTGYLDSDAMWLARTRPSAESYREQRLGECNYRANRHRTEIRRLKEHQGKVLAWVDSLEESLNPTEE